MSSKTGKKSEGKSPQVYPTQMWQISRLANGNSQFLSFFGDSNGMESFFGTERQKSEENKAILKIEHQN